WWGGPWWVPPRGGGPARRWAGIPAAVVAGIAVVRAVEFTRGTPWLTLYISTWSRLDAPLVGALAALALRAGWLARRPRRLTLAGTLGLAAILAAAFATTCDLGALPDGLYTLLAVGVGATVAAVVVAPHTRLATALGWRPLVALGLISYSLYLWHVGIFLAMERYDPPWPGPVRLVVGLGLSFGISV